MNKIKPILIILFALFCCRISEAKNNTELWYTKPAEKWANEALPIGNGRMGAMFFGGIQLERIQFNEQSLWSGENNWDGEYETGDLGFGSYRNFGEISIDFANQTAATNYRRALDISNGIHTTTFEQNGIKFTREGFASYPDQVLVFNYSTTKKGALTGKITFKSAQGAATTASLSGLSFSGEMPNKLKYAARVQLLHKGGQTRVEGNQLIFENCSSFTLLLDARTNYQPDYRANWRGNDPLPTIEKELTKAESKTYKDLKTRHLADLSVLLGRVKLTVGNTSPELESLPTDQRLVRYSNIKNVQKDNVDTLSPNSRNEDIGLELLLFQYGRYILASSSRPGGLPANLQGLWNDSNTPAWASDYHNNINVQMNYWAAETTNLSECQIPLVDFITAALEPCRIATRKAFGDKTRGWTARTSQSIFGGNGWEWNIPASAWYAQHVYEHWAFTQDNNYLRQTAYPIIKEICEYWEDNLKKMPDGTLMVPNGWSPEHGPREDGIMHDQQLVWDLFQNYLDAAKALKIDTDYQKRIAEMQAQLAPNKIGKWGQLQEWQEDRDDPNDQHRHTSHLFAVYPGRQISINKTPELAKAAIVSLRSRSGNYGKNENTTFTVESTIGDSRRSWTWPWRCGLWARLGEGEKAGMMIRGLLTYNTTPNLFTSHPPFQIDGNLGIPGGMAEMLLQSHAGEISLLPAIPKKWADKGSFSGLRARGGFWVSCTWENGRVLDYKITSAKPTKVKVRVNGELKEINTRKTRNANLQ